MELREEIQKILDDALQEYGIHVHWKKRRDDVGSEYVTFLLISSPTIAYAGNKPVLRRYNYDVKYYFESEQDFSTVHLEVIKQAMAAAGFTLPNGAIPSMGDRQDTACITMEFRTERVI